ncbi:hypothetical protein VPHD164_0052 [Vibrio phage D164]
MDRRLEGCKNTHLDRFCTWIVSSKIPTSSVTALVASFQKTKTD